MNILIVLQLVGHFDIVVNCTGLGSKYLLPDESVYAVKGQLIQVSEAHCNPQVYCFYINFLLYQNICVLMKAVTTNVFKSKILMYDLISYLDNKDC